MAEAEAPEIVTETKKDMEVETPNAETHGDSGELNSKRAREEDGLQEENDGAKKPKAEEQSLEEVEGSEAVDGDGEKCMVPVTVGSKSFGSSVEMFDYFYKFLHYWTPNLNVNKYEHIMLLDLIKKGHLEPERKIGNGIHAFQIRYHPEFKSRCFFLIRGDESVDDFSFRKCVDHILPLPENMQVNKGLGGGGGGYRGGKFGGGGGRGGGRGRGRGRGGKSRN